MSPPCALPRHAVTVSLPEIDRVKNHRKEKLSPPGFTLIELLVVVAIIAVIAALLLPALGKMQESGRTAQCLSNMRQMGIAVRLYAQDNDGLLPWGKSAGSGSVWSDAIAPYAGVEGPAGSWSTPIGVMECPSARFDSVPLAWGKGYAMNDCPGYPDLVPESWKRNWQEAWCARTGESEPRQFKMAEITFPTKRYLIGDAHTWDVGVDELPASFNSAQMDSNGFVAANRHGKGRSNVLFFDGHAASLTPEQVYYSITDPSKY